MSDNITKKTHGIKVAVIGDSGSGKTTLLKNFRDARSCVTYTRFDSVTNKSCIVLDTAFGLLSITLSETYVSNEHLDAVIYMINMSETSKDDFQSKVSDAITLIKHQWSDCKVFVGVINCPDKLNFPNVEGANGYFDSYKDRLNPILTNSLVHLMMNPAKEAETITTVKYVNVIGGVRKMTTIVTNEFFMEGKTYSV